MAPSSPRRRDRRDNLSLARAFAEWSVSWHRHAGVDDVLAGAVAAAADLIDDSIGATAVLRRNGTNITVASTDPQVVEVDALQFGLDEGPSLDALVQPFAEACDTSWSSWPALATKRPSGLGAITAFGLGALDQNEPGALVVYRRSAAPIGHGERELGLILAAHAGVAVAVVRERLGATTLVDQLREAMTTRDVIGQAKGVLMERQHIDADEAFDVLRRASQRSNVKLRDLAEQLATSAHTRSDD